VYHHEMIFSSVNIMLFFLVFTLGDDVVGNNTPGDENPSCPPRIPSRALAAVILQASFFLTRVEIAQDLMRLSLLCT